MENGVQYFFHVQASSYPMMSCPELTLRDEALTAANASTSAALALEGLVDESLLRGGDLLMAVTGDPAAAELLGRDDAIQNLKYYSYGIALPTICGLGILGNILNLVVLTRPTMRGPAYVYMRGYAVAALLAIVFAVPFSGRILFHNEIGPWNNFAQAFFHTHLELFLGNACLGIGVFMLVALTVERYVAVCRLGQTRTFEAQKTPLVATGLSVVAISLYLPYLFRAGLLTCTDMDGHVTYRKMENPAFIQSTVWAAYLWILEVIFKMGPTLIIVHLNCCIIVAYRKTCANRRRMVKKPTPVPTPAPVCHNGRGPTNQAGVNYTSIHNIGGRPLHGHLQANEESSRFWEEKRLMFLLGSTSILFFVCIMPQLVLSLMIHEDILKSYYFQVFRAVANILEVTNYSMTFYIYCLFSRDFRSTLLQTLQIPRAREPSTTAQTCL